MKIRKSTIHEDVAGILEENRTMEDNTMLSLLKAEGRYSNGKVDDDDDEDNGNG